ncbi:MAG: hypothetical protein F6K10_26700 [Moorea sp. SIO2B7]|nr:hypothetical protein [Moorena sp. SIO2B7]
MNYCKHLKPSDGIAHAFPGDVLSVERKLFKKRAIANRNYGREMVYQHSCPSQKSQ